MTNELLMAILQWCSGAFLLVLVPLLGWTVKQVHTLRADFEGHKGKMNSEIPNIKRRADNDRLVIDRRFDEQRDWLKSNGSKLDDLIHELVKRPCQAHKGKSNHETLP
jgi:hypothetical protein